MSALSSTDAGCNTGLGAWRTSLGPEPGLESDPKLTGSALPHLTLPPSYFSLGVQRRLCCALLLPPPWTGLRRLPTDNRTLRVVREPSNREGVWEPRSQHVLETGWWAVGAGRGAGRRERGRRARASTSTSARPAVLCGGGARVRGPALDAVLLRGVSTAVRGARCMEKLFCRSGVR